MKHTIYLMALSVVTFFSVSFRALSQTSSTGYFMDNYSYRYMMNPALVPYRGFVSVPVLGNLQADVHYNFGMDNFLFPSSGGKLVTFLHPSVDAGSFLSHLQDINTFSQNMNAGILNVGFYVGKSFFDFGINLHQDVSLSLPKELFAFLKQGQQSSLGSVYDIRDLNMNANAYIDVSLGGSTPIFDNFRVGGRLKVLLGAAAAKVNVNRLCIEMSDDVWRATSDMEGVLYGKGLDLTINESQSPFAFDFNFPDGYGLAGAGLAVDLGVTYTPIEHLTVSLAVTDLGWMSWKKEAAEMIRAKGTHAFSGFENLTYKEAGDQIESQLEQMADKFEELVHFQEVQPDANAQAQLNTSFTAGVEYGFLKDRLSAGLLYSNKAIRYGKNVNDFSVSANLRFIRDIQFSASYMLSNYGNGFGVALSVAQVLFFALDNYSYELTPMGLPVRKAGPSVSMGLNIPLSKIGKAKRELKPWGYFGSFQELFSRKKSE